MLNFDRIAAAQAVHAPFSHISADHVLDTEALVGVGRDFPGLDGPGLFTLDGLKYGPSFERLIEDLRRPAFQRLMEEKFEIDLSDKPLMITARGFCQRKDGRIHVDSTDKGY